ncbi:MAG TPA: hypothetical protein VKZ98_10060, partial [Aquaticitalea sp.]|nr:hypothetical protein [Aquaticitalea sp.]
NVFFTEESGKLTGASDLLLNADVSYFKEFNKNKNLLATVSYSYFSDRINSIGTNGRGDLVDQAVGNLDFILKTNINEHIGLDFKVRNILDPKVETVQETQDVIVESYRKGINVSFSMSYKF